MKKQTHKVGIEYEALKIIEKNPHFTQREVASELGLSLGKTNYVIRELIKKGWVKLQNFSKSKTKSGYLYILTPSGFKNKTILAKDFLKTKIMDFELLKKEINTLEKDIS